MANVLCSRARLVCYLPELHVLVHRVAGPRVLSAAAPSVSYGSHVTLTPSDMGKHTVWHLGPSESNNQCVQLQRDVNHLEEEARQQSLTQKMVPELLFSSLSRERYESKVADCITEFYEEDQTAFSLNRPEKYFHNSIVECAIQSCPDPLKQDLQCMFPEAPASCMTVVTVAQRTQNDMVAWSTQVEHERDQMLDKFVSGAKEICSALQREGFWADFIDPSSGLAFFGSYTNNTLFETDDRYRHLGFQIEDLGCCRVIRHALWGTHVFVGTIVTNSPPSSNIMKKLQES